MSEQPEAARTRSQHTRDASPRRGGGLGLATALVLAGALCLGIPGYLSASFAWTVAWRLVGGLLGAVGAAGAFIEAGKVARAEGFGTIAAALVVATPAAMLHLLQSEGVLAPAVANAFRVVVVVLLLFSITGAGVAVGKLVRSLTTGSRPDFPPPLVWSVASLGLAIAGVSVAPFNFL